MDVEGKLTGILALTPSVPPFPQPSLTPSLLAFPLLPPLSLSQSLPFFLPPMPSKVLR